MNLLNIFFHLLCYCFCFLFVWNLIKRMHVFFFIKCSDYFSVNLLIILLSRSFTFFSHSSAIKKMLFFVFYLYSIQSVLPDVEPFSG